MIKLKTIRSFLQRSTNLHKDHAGNDAYFNQLRRREFSRLDQHGHVYLDYTGGSLYPDSLIRAHHSFLRSGIFGNPHSTNPASLISEELVNEARRAVLDFFNAQEYYCIFTNNASGALHIVGECYPFNESSHLLLTADNHNSVNGIREYCVKKGGKYSYSPMNYEDLRINEGELIKHLTAHSQKKNKLFAYPAQSNVSGVRHSLTWIELAHELGWDVLLDAAAFVPTSKLDLFIHQPDFVSLSFYKIFGYPTGIGCLLVRKSKFEKLIKPSYAGGTITLSSVRYGGHFLKTNHEKFENGTVNYLGIPAVTNGLNFIHNIGMEKISKRVEHLCSLVIAELSKLRHNNGQPFVKIYGPRNTESRGGTFLLNFFDVEGQKYPFEYMEQMANAKLISFRTGCFCNPGIDELNHCISPDQLKSYFVSRDHGDYFDFINFTGQMRGAVRISVGIATTETDLANLISFLKKFLNKMVPAHENVKPTLSSIYLLQLLRPLKVGIHSL